MSNKMTPCERLGYKVGDKFKASKSGAWFNVGEEVELGRDDGSNYPYFFNARMPKDSDGGWPRHIESVEKISNAKLKPAKQALADAIHQNGGWPNHCDCKFATSNDRSLACFFTERPVKGKWTEWSGWVRVMVLSPTTKPLPNRHQCILSRDEYFTAYPEQVKVEVENETEHKVEVEMKSESEVIVKVGGDWHKNGELPPVGEVCEWLECSQTGWQTVTVAGYYLNAAWLVPKGKEPITVYNPTGFRPLRTERDRAIDEIVSEFIDHYGDPKGGERYLGIAAKLYDAGYRKEVKQ